MITAKPHHLLDIFKLYGAGVKKFTPDPFYGHDFYRIGNLVLDDPNLRVKFTIGVDDICKPCKYLKSKECSDFVSGNPEEYSSKEFWNKTIDKRIMNELSIEDGIEMTVGEYCKLALERLNEENISEIWKERPQKETDKRTKLLLKGLRKYYRDYL